jgi:hypothetical protein
VNGAAEARSDAPRGHERQSLGTALGHPFEGANAGTPQRAAPAIGSSAPTRAQASELEPRLHRAAIVLVTIARLMTPAAITAWATVDCNPAFLAPASRLVISAMLALAQTGDRRPPGRARITGTPVLGLAISSAARAMLALLWLVFPQWRAAHPERAPR